MVPRFSEKRIADPRSFCYNIIGSLPEIIKKLPKIINCQEE